jgi:alpha-beta hydrolase superfamily lysophospholipase
MDTTFTLNRPDGEKLACYNWRSKAKPWAVLVIAHGMGEHAGRYRTSLDMLISSGVIIYAFDQRGHGYTARLNEREVGDFGSGGFDAVVGDLAAFVKHARVENPALPLLLLGHSMGSFISQAFLIEHGKMLDGAVLVGTTAVDILAEAMMKEKDLITALNRPFEPGRTEFDWLSSDPQQVDAYIDDPLCGFSLVPDSMISLFSQGTRLASKCELALIPSCLPIYILVGAKDVLLTDFGRLEPLVDRYINAGLKPTVVIYPEGRHEILNESNRDEVVVNLLKWLKITSEAVIRRTNDLT